MLKTFVNLKVQHLNNLCVFQMCYLNTTDDEDDDEKKGEDKNKVGRWKRRERSKRGGADMKVEEGYAKGWRGRRRQL